MMVKTIFDFVFRVETFLVAMFGLLMLALFMAVNAENENRAETQRLTEACYNQGQVLVNTDAGQRCVNPQYLVKVK
jgi:hypothetical protein